ncbi:LysR family transcriptional regulator [Geminicoccaceae bacterium 1502E]|nr:LysR family transcriptional regulator [Geminicoccaceae bacterium 1502E]
MRFTLAQLEAFFWIARLGSVQQAARQLNLAQPTVSLRLRDLEAAIGTKLFERVGRGLQLGHDGVALLEHASAILAEVGRIQDRIGRDGEVRGVVRVGFAETFALVCLPTLLQLLGRDHAALRLETVVSTSSMLEQEVRERRLDLAFAINPSGDPRLRLLPLGVQENSWVAAPKWRLGSAIRPADIRHLPIISNPHPAPMFRQINAWFRSAGLEPLRLSYCNSVTVIAHLVAAGVAVGFLPRKMIDADAAAGRVDLLASRPPVEKSTVHAVYRVDDGIAAVGAVIKAARQVLGTIEFLEPP